MITLTDKRIKTPSGLVARLDLVFDDYMTINALGKWSKVSTPDR